LKLKIKIFKKKNSANYEKKQLKIRKKISLKLIY